jgi:hypothetical protein
MLVVALCLFLIAPAGARQDASSEGLVPFTRLADNFLEARGLAGIERNDGALAVVLDAAFVNARLGLFRVWYPRSALSDADSFKDFKAAAQALVDLQSGWLEWAADKEKRKDGLKEARIIGKWIRSWKAAAILAGTGKEGSGPDILGLLEGDDHAAVAAKSFADRLAGGGYLSGDREVLDEILLILSPTRENFLGLGSFIGSLNDENRRLLWHDGLALWTSFKRGRIHVIALEHPAAYPGRGDITKGISMDAREKTGLLQHVVQTATEHFLVRVFGDALPGDVRNGLAMVMVVNLFKENNVRAGGGSGGTTSAGSSRFVRGGKSSGGTLAATSAEPRWRENKGADHFLKILRQAQKDGAKDALISMGGQRDRRAFFTLQTMDGDRDVFVRAPFLTPGAPREPVPDAYADDFLEFHRAYRCAFAYWLTEKAKRAKDRTSPDRLLQQLLQSIPAQSGEGAAQGFERAVLDVYGVAFTAKDSEEKSLEWRFLEWLSMR